MPGFLGGGSSGSSGTGGEISFPKEFVDPVTKLRVSNPQNLIDTDFEYGLQPTKWETVELINNTPSFFSKSGDTTIPNIVAITTNAGTREIIVETALDHGLAVGIPISVTGTKSVTADGSYIINSIPNTKTFTYLCKDNQTITNSIEDLYSSVITGEFFQGSQLRISDSAGITTDGAAISLLTVTTDSTHGFGIKTPFYFLNLNSTISQEFEAANTASRSFDASNSATAQTFDGSNTLSSFGINFSNSAVEGGVTSSLSMTSADVSNGTLTVAHGTENFANAVLGTPVYYAVVGGSGYFDTNPRGVVFIKSTDALGTSSSTFQVSEVPDGDAIPITSTMTGTVQLANQARIFAGNNINPVTEQTIEIINDASQPFDATNTLGTVGTVTGYSAGNVTVTSPVDLEWYFGTMVLYSTTGSPATGLTNNTTYFIDSYFRQGTSDNYSFTLKPLPSGSVLTSISGGTGTQTFRQIGISVDKDVIHLKDNGFELNDMVRYGFPEGNRFSAASVDQEKNFYFVSIVYDAHNFMLNETAGELQPLTVDRVDLFSGSPITPTSVTAIGFTGALTYTIESGTLPTGLTLNSATGSVSGTPTENIAAPGRVVVIRGTDSTGAFAIQTHTYQFNQPPQLYEFTTATFTPGGATGPFGPSTAQARSGAGSPSWASEYINTSGGIILWTVPKTGNYNFTLAGAVGGNSTGNAQLGGHGAIGTISNVAFTQGDVLRMVVGQRGLNAPFSTSAGGGGGASFIQRTGATVPLAVAPGGGGGSNNQTGRSTTSFNRGLAARRENTTSTAAGVGAFNQFVNGSHEGGGGASWTSNGVWQVGGIGTGRLGQRLNGSANGGTQSGGGGAGGFGGGGAGGQGNGAGGGGGGYRGGWGGVYSDPGQASSGTGGQSGSGGWGFGLAYPGTTRNDHGFITVTAV
jgi:hypothetical protein